MQPGDVLVAAITTPAWTPLFALASAVVTDIGGPMSHGSIVAREYGIPAVLGTGVATKRIVSGQQIRVDGDAGTVTLLDEVGERGATAQAPARSRARKWAPLVLAAGVLLGAMMRNMPAERQKRLPQTGFSILFIIRVPLIGWKHEQRIFNILMG